METNSESVKKEEGFFGTFNTEDILTDPACEINDQIREENDQTFRNASDQIQPNSTEERATNESTKEYPYEREKPSTSFGLKIADFAIDPDSCVVISTAMATTTQTTQNGWIPQILPDHLKLTRLSFMHPYPQYEKLYQVKFHTNSKEYREYYILTSRPEQNKAEYKLFISAADLPSFQANNLVDIQVEYDQQIGFFAFKFPYRTIMVRHVEDLSSFMNGISIGQNLLVTGGYIQRFANEFAVHSQNLNHLIPTFRYKITGVSCMFSTDLAELGYEGVPMFMIRNNQERWKTVTMISKRLNEHYPPSIMGRVKVMAMLMERDLNKQVFDSKVAMHEHLFQMKSQFVSKIWEYPALASHPDILYQVVFKSINISYPGASLMRFSSKIPYSVPQACAQPTPIPAKLAGNQFVETQDLMFQPRTVIAQPPRRVITQYTQPTPGHSRTRGIQEITYQSAVFVDNSHPSENQLQTYLDSEKLLTFTAFHYKLFSEEMKESVTRENPGLGSGEISKLIYVKWRTLSLDQKNEFIRNSQKENKEKEKENSESKSKKIFCKGCKRLIAWKSNGVLHLDTSLVNLQCKQCKQEVTCRMCDVKIHSLVHCTLQQKYEQIEKHLDSDEHSQKETVFDFLNFYAHVKGFDMEKKPNMDNLKFFLTALTAMTLQSKIAVMNCLSVIMNIGDLSLGQYNDLYKHVDKLVTARIPNFVCFACNFLGYSDIEELKCHTDSVQHMANNAKLIKEEKHMACTKCFVLFHVANIYDHKGHVAVGDVNQLSSEGEKGEQTTNNTRKRKHSENEEDNDPTYSCIDDDVVDEDDDLDEYVLDEDDLLDEDTADLEKEIERNYPGIFSKRKKRRRLHSSNVKEKEDFSFRNSDISEACFEDKQEEAVSYYYFCLDCEEKSAGHDPDCSHLHHPRVPISINLAAHIKTTNHQNFIPINDNTKVQIKNISFSQDFNKLIIKKWIRLVKDGDITEVKYNEPRMCKKCRIVIEDAIDMFKHIKDVHVNI